MAVCLKLLQCINTIILSVIYREGVDLGLTLTPVTLHSYPCHRDYPAAYGMTLPWHHVVQMFTAAAVNVSGWTSQLQFLVCRFNCLCSMSSQELSQNIVYQNRANEKNTTTFTRVQCCWNLDEESWIMTAGQHYWKSLTSWSDICHIVLHNSHHFGS